MQDRSLPNLRKAQIRIHRELDKLEPLLESYRAKLAEVEAAIQALDPQLALPTRHRRYRDNPAFKRGELPRVMRDVMRTAGRPLATREVVALVLSRKGITLPTPALWRLVRVRTQQTFANWKARGIVEKVGSGVGTVRRLRDG